MPARRPGSCAEDPHRQPTPCLRNASNPPDPHRDEPRRPAGTLRRNLGRRVRRLGSAGEVSCPDLALSRDDTSTAPSSAPVSFAASSAGPVIRDTERGHCSPALEDPCLIPHPSTGRSGCEPPRPHWLRLRANGSACANPPLQNLGTGTLTALMSAVEGHQRPCRGKRLELGPSRLAAAHRKCSADAPDAPSIELVTARFVSAAAIETAVHAASLDPLLCARLPPTARSTLQLGCWY